MKLGRLCRQKVSRGNNAFQPPLFSATMAVNVMSPDDRKRAYKRDLLLASAMVAAGLAIFGLSVAQLAAHNPQVVQATQPLQSSPTPAPQDNQPAESKPGGERPTTPAPEPARPDAEAQKTGATPALPPAPAEKTAAPIKER
jgi:hypothetical protein